MSVDEGYGLAVGQCIKCNFAGSRRTEPESGEDTVDIERIDQTVAVLVRDRAGRIASVHIASKACEYESGMV